MEGVNVGRWIDENEMDGGDCFKRVGADHDPCAYSMECVIGSSDY